jgi:hypothetical protein
VFAGKAASNAILLKGLFLQLLMNHAATRPRTSPYPHERIHTESGAGGCEM